MSSEKKDLSSVIESNLPIIVKMGKIVFGTRNAERILRSRKEKIVLTATNIPPYLEKRIRSIAEKRKIPTFKSNKSNIELGELCGRPHVTSTIAIIDFGGTYIKEAEIIAQEH